MSYVISFDKWKSELWAYDFREGDAKKFFEEIGSILNVVPWSWMTADEPRGDVKRVLHRLKV